MKIEDDFLDPVNFKELQTIMMSDKFAWFYNSYIVSDIEPEKEFQFTHSFYKDNVPISPFMEQIVPILKIINPVSVYRIKANLLTRTPNIMEHEFHIDMGRMSEEKQKQWTTSIFYMNTNNGYTKFEDGTIVESVANRMNTFPSNMKHTGTSCTDEKTRVVINFNYFKQ